jgi:hypothetical protein
MCMFKSIKSGAYVYTLNSIQCQGIVVLECGILFIQNFRLVDAKLEVVAPCVKIIVMLPCAIQMHRPFPNSLKNAIT